MRRKTPVQITLMPDMYGELTASGLERAARTDNDSNNGHAQVSTAHGAYNEIYAHILTHILSQGAQTS